MSGETGSERIRELLSAGELGQVPPDGGLARRMLADAGRHLATAAAAANEPAPNRKVTVFKTASSF